MRKSTSKSHSNRYSSPSKEKMDCLTMIAELIGSEFLEKVNTTLKNRLTAAHLKRSPEELADCVDSNKREYLPIRLPLFSQFCTTF